MAKSAASLSYPHFNNEHGILKNIPGFTDQGELDKFERIAATKSIINLGVIPVRGRLDAAHLRRIHSSIFGNIYPWAGEFRPVNMCRAGSYPFAAVQFLEKNLDSTFAKLAEEGHLKRLDVDNFAGRAAYYLGEMNSIHPLEKTMDVRNASSFGNLRPKLATASTGFALPDSKWSMPRSKATTAAGMTLSPR